MIRSLEHHLTGHNRPRFVALAQEDTTHVSVIARHASYEIDVDARAWRYVASRDGEMEEEYPALANAGGRTFVFGGIENERAEQYDRNQQLWSPTEYSYIEPRSAAAVINLNEERVLIVGGIASWPWAGWVIASSEVFDARANRFINAGQMKHPRAAPAILELQPGIPMVIGGNNNVEGFTNSVEVFDPSCAELDGGSP